MSQITEKKPQFGIVMGVKTIYTPDERFRLKVLGLARRWRADLTVEIFGESAAEEYLERRLLRTKGFSVVWPRRADLSFLQGALKAIFVNRVVGGQWESKVIPF